MTVATATQQALVSSPSVSDFLTEIRSIEKEFGPIKPSRFNFTALSSWREEKNKRIGEVVERHVRHESNGLSAQEDLQISAETLEEASRQLVKSTCMMEKAQKDKVHIDIHKVFKFNKEPGFIGFTFVTLKNGKLGFSETIEVQYRDLTCLFDVSEDKSMFLTGMRASDGSSWFKNVELHVHSEDDLKFLFE